MSEEDDRTPCLFELNSIEKVCLHKHSLHHFPTTLTTFFVEPRIAVL